MAHDSWSSRGGYLNHQDPSADWEVGNNLKRKQKDRSKAERMSKPETATKRAKNTWNDTISNGPEALKVRYEPTHDTYYKQSKGS